MDNPFRYSEKQRVLIVNQQRKDIKDLYKQAVNELSRNIGQLKNTTKESSVKKRQNLKAIQKELKAEFKNIDRSTEKLIKGNVNNMIGIVLENNVRYLSGLGFENIRYNSAVKKDMVQALLNGDLYNNKWNLSSAIWGDNAKKNEEIKNIVAKGILKNKSTYEIAKDLERYVNPQARIQTKWLDQVSGRRRKIDYNAQRLARTMVSHAYEEAFVKATINNPFIDAYRWLTSGSDKVCPICIDRETADHYGLGEGIYPKDQLPLDHPNGMCTFESVITMSDAEIADAVEDWYFDVGDEELNRQIDIMLEDFE